MFEQEYVSCSADGFRYIKGLQLPLLNCSSPLLPTLFPPLCQSQPHPHPTLVPLPILIPVQVLEQCSNGLDVAEADLRLRGPGAVFASTTKQSGSKAGCIKALHPCQQ